MPSTNRLTWRLLALYAATDLLFKLLTFPLFLVGLNLDDAGARRGATVRFLVVLIPSLALFAAGLVRIVRPVEQWLAADAVGAASPEAIARAGARLYRLPLYTALAWGLEWLWVYAALVAEVDAWRAVPVWLMVVALAIGTPPLGYLLTVWTTNAATERISIEARRAGIQIDVPRLTMRRQMTVFALCLTTAPSTFIVSIALTARMTLMPMGELVGLVALSFVTIAIYAVLCARLFADAIAAPVERMSEAIRSIAEQGEVAAVGRVPRVRRDELGTLAEWTNRMIDRLEQTERARAEMSTSLESLNRNLEQRVEERTVRLAQVNASLAREMKTRSQMEIELRQAQKLEAVGRLAAGVAHEINTPVQFVSDSIHFVRDAMTDLTALVSTYRDALDGRAGADRVAEAESTADLDYLLTHVPRALERSIDGLQRLSTIVRSMKEFAHPDQKEMAAVDLNQAIQSTLIIARSEYKYVADVELDLGPLPPVTCHGGDVNQVILNIVVNAAHAISDHVAGRELRGRIGVHTHQDDAMVVIAISDTGGGIPPEVQERIFDPFFTTKEVGRGTGQGLAIARSVIDKHGGELTFFTEAGQGTTFLVRLPIEGRMTTSPGANYRTNTASPMGAAGSR